MASTTYVTVISSLIHRDTLPLRLINSPLVFTSPPARLFLIKCVAAFPSPSYTHVSLAASPVGAGRSCAGYGRVGAGAASGKRFGSADLGSGLCKGCARYEATRSVDSSDVILSHTAERCISPHHGAYLILTSVGGKHDESELLASLRVEFTIRHFRPGSHIGRRIVPRSARTRFFAFCLECLCNPLNIVSLDKQYVIATYCAAWAFVHL